MNSRLFCVSELSTGLDYDIDAVVHPVKINRMGFVKDLDVLEFKTINSNVFVIKSAVYVPTTLVFSNKLDATAFGMQSFGEDYEYHLMVFLSDILTGKSKKRIKKQDKIGEEITKTDRNGIKVVSYSLDGESKSGLDNDDDRNEMKRIINVDEALLNIRFHPGVISYNTGVE